MAKDKAKLKFDVVTIEKVVYSKKADVISAPTRDGQISILPGHDSLVTLIDPGEIEIQSGSERISLATGGGFLEVANNEVRILADSAEYPEDIDVAEAEELRKQALKVVKGETSDELNLEQALKALEHARARLKVAKKK